MTLSRSSWAKYDEAAKETPILGDFFGSSTVSVASVGVSPAEFLRLAFSSGGEHAARVSNDSGRLCLLVFSVPFSVQA